MSLKIVATPIGNYSDITLRALEVLKNCDILIGEEHRVASTTLKKIGLEQKEIYLLNEHSKKKDIDELVELCQHKNVALISDCGTPGFSDPGADLIRACRIRGIPVTSLPGASSLMTLISLSSQKITQFTFLGFLPAKKEERQKALEDLRNEKRCWVLMDTPYRLRAVLQDLAGLMPNERGLLGLNLTQDSEKVLEGTFRELEKKCPQDEAEFILLRYGRNLAFACLLLFSWAMLSCTTTPVADMERPPFFIMDSMEVIATEIPPSPSPTSLTTKNDFKELLRWQRERRPQDCEQALKDADLKPALKLFGPQNNVLTGEKYERLLPLFERITWDSKILILALKNKYARPRPYLVDQKLQPCAPLEESAAYPSGHAAIGRLFGLILSDIDPTNAELYQKRGAQIGLLRVISGVHHPSDIESGRKLGDLLYKKIIENKNYREEIRRLRLELQNSQVDVNH